jgi:hypothetical protein
VGWLAWLQEEQNVPDRTDHYLMQIAALLAKGRSLEDMRIRFEPGAEQRLSVEEASAQAKARSLARMTLPVRIVQRGAVHGDH